MFIKIKKWLLNLKVTDYLILLAVLVIGVFFFASFYKKPESIYVDVTTLRNDYSQDMTPPEYWQLSGIKTGDGVFNSFGKEVAKLINLEKTPWRLGTMEAAEMTLQYSAVFNPRERVYTVDGVPLRVGDKIAINFGSRKFTGLIRNVYKQKEDRFAGFSEKSGTLVLELRDYDPWQIEKIKNFVLKDSDGNVLVKVLGVKSELSNLYVVDANNNAKLMLGKNPNKVDATVTMKLGKIICASSGACFFNYYHQIGIGNGFYADNGQTSFGYNSSIIDFKTD